MITDTMQDITVDVVVSFGPNCRAADALKRNHLRFFSSPFDWMMKYKLQDVYNILKNKGKDFFSDFKESEISNGTKYRYIISESTGMVAMHHFYKFIPVDEAYFIFNNKMQKRFAKLDEILLNAKSLCIITSRHSKTDDIINFVNDFSNLYKFEKVYFINIYNDSVEKIEKVIYKNLTIYQCHFSDVHPDGNNRMLNKKFWKGNVEIWDDILRKIRLNRDFTEKYMNKDAFCNIPDDDYKTRLRIFFLSIKYHLYRYINILLKSLLRYKQGG